MLTVENKPMILSVVMLGVIMMSAVMLNVVAPFKSFTKVHCQAPWDSVKNIWIITGACTLKLFMAVIIIMVK
jgi:hypothetical protein